MIYSGNMKSLFDFQISISLTISEKILVSHQMIKDAVESIQGTLPISKPSGILQVPNYIHLNVQ